MWTKPSIPSPTWTKEPNGTNLVTRPYTSSPTWWAPANSCQGSCWVAFSERLMRSRLRSTSSTWTSISSPTATTEPGWSTCFQDNSETWTRPSMPPRSTKAPKLTTLDTTPLRTSPGRKSWRNSSRCSFWVSSSQARRDRTTLLRFLSSSMILASTVVPMYGCRSRTRRNSTSEAGRKPRRPISTMRPPLTTSMTEPETIPSPSLISSILPQARSY